MTQAERSRLVVRLAENAAASYQPLSWSTRQMLGRCLCTLMLNKAAFWRARAEAFQALLGQFARDGLGDADRAQISAGGSITAINVGPAWQCAPVPSAVGLAPLLFLRPGPAPDDPRDVRCSFAAPVRQAISGQSGPKPLICTLGPAGQPYSCALYPLGDVWRGPERTWYSLDHGGCEGVGPASGGTHTGAASRTVEEYRQTNSLGPRQAAAHWFKRLATAHACSGLEDDTAVALGLDGPTNATQHISRHSRVPATRASQARPVDVSRLVARLQTDCASLPWLQSSLSIIHGELTSRGLAWLAVEPLDLATRLLRDRTRDLWYAPVEAGVVPRLHLHTDPSLHLHNCRDVSEPFPMALRGWDECQRWIEAATAQLHEQWRGTVLPALRAAAARQERSM